MKFECGDLERALERTELMPEAREHLKTCPACRREYRLWTDISSSARELHEEWESPGLWPGIRQSLEAQKKAEPTHHWAANWRFWGLVAACLLVVAGLFVYRLSTAKAPPAAAPAATTAAKPTPADRDFLTEQALAETERAEAAYRNSINKLSQIAAPELQNPNSAVAVNYKEKLLLLDSAISETRANLDHNRFSVRLQTELADLYREKKQTLQELLSRDQKN